MEIRVGPLPLADYLVFLPGGSRLETLRKAVRHGVGETFDVDFRPLLRAADIPPARIGAAAVGRTAWLAPRRTADAGDLRLRAIVGLTPEGARAAA
jgi:type VI secretion system protein ImpH